MLIRVRASNIFSFHKEVEFSLIPGKESSLSDHIVHRGTRNQIPALRTAVLYGANASGKSNLVKVMSLIQELVSEDRNVEHELPMQPFKLASRIKDNAEVEVEFKKGSKNYAYGLVFNKRYIKEEWLHMIDKSKDQQIFHRKSTLKGSEVTFEDERFQNEEELQFMKFIGKGLPINKTFIYECFERNVKVISSVIEVFNWFADDLKILFPRSKFQGLEFHLSNNTRFEKSFSNLLHHFGTGIDCMTPKELDYEKDIKDIPREQVDNLIVALEPDKKALLTDLENSSSYAFEKDKKGNVTAYRLYTERRNEMGKAVTFDVHEESDGTRRLFDLAPMLIELENENSVFLVDELDRSMHPLMVKGLMSFFLQRLNKKVKSQLIVTTHESHLLDLEMFRKDEIWFVEKDKKGHSALYSLLDFQPRKDKDIRKGYLNGRYGAIPFLSDPSNLSW